MHNGCKRPPLSRAAELDNFFEKIHKGNPTVGYGSLGKVSTGDVVFAARRRTQHARKERDWHLRVECAKITLIDAEGRDL